MGSVLAAWRERSSFWAHLKEVEAEQQQRLAMTRPIAGPWGAE
jgi:hypothetical protein